MDVCKYPFLPSNVSAPLTHGPFFHMEKALALKLWDTPEEQRLLANSSASNVISWVHVAVTEKLMAPVNGYTIEVFQILKLFLLSLICDLCLETTGLVSTKKGLDKQGLPGFI